jgi:toxin ParE1/3/4
MWRKRLNGTTSASLVWVRKFVREVDQAIARVVENPLAFPVILKRHEVRRALTKRFPYRIFFSLKSDAVVVHAVLHGHRGDRHWKDRL